MRKWVRCMILALTVMLAGCAATKPLDGLAIPYGDHETFTYTVSANGQELTEADFVVKKDQYEQQPAWLMMMELKLNGQTEVNEVWADLDSLLPFFSRVQLKMPQGDYDIRATYGEKIRLVADTPQGQQQVERQSGGTVYDNAQILMTLRALPLSEGYRAKLSFVQTKNVSRGELTVRVVGSERVQVPAGEFDCYRVEMSIQGVKQNVWYSTDDKHWLIKYDNGQSQFALREVQ